MVFCMKAFPLIQSCSITLRITIDHQMTNHLLWVAVKMQKYNFIRTEQVFCSSLKEKIPRRKRNHKVSFFNKGGIKIKSNKKLPSHQKKRIPPRVIIDEEEVFIDVIIPLFVSWWTVDTWKRSANGFLKHLKNNNNSI